MIVLSNRHKLDFACGAGALAFDGRGWLWDKPLIWTGRIRPDQLTVVAKTVTFKKRRGNLRWWKPWSCVRLFRGGVVNAVSMTNRGFLWWIKKPYKRVQASGYKIAVSIQAENAGEVKTMAKAMNNLDLAYVEMNLSCPNTDHSSSILTYKDMLDAYNEECELPLVVKLSFDQSMDDCLLQLLDAHESVEAIHAINSVPFHNVYPGEESPVQESTGREGGVSGKAIFPFVCDAVKNIRAKTRLPIIAGGGISSTEDVLTMESHGADAFSIGVLFLRKPCKPRKIINEYRANIGKREYATV